MEIVRERRSWRFPAVVVNLHCCRETLARFGATFVASLSDATYNPRAFSRSTANRLEETMARPTDPKQNDDEARKLALSRRRFLRGAGEVAAGGVLAQGLLAACATAEATETQAKVQDDGTVEVLEGEVEIELSINGQSQKVTVEPRTTLLNTLRNHCSPPLTGTKLVCDRGNCGACTVTIDGHPAYACLQLAVDQRGKHIRTIEGLAKGDELTPLQDEFCKHDALMCGFCTPGFVMAITACLEKNPRAELSEIREACAGNVCRCGTYPHIFEAALAAGRRLAGGR